jgi:hypothetical protein
MTELELCAKLIDVAKQHYPMYGRYVFQSMTYSPGTPTVYKAELDVIITKFQWESLESREAALTGLLVELTLHVWLP